MSRTQTHMYALCWLAAALTVISACQPKAPALTIEKAWVRPAPPAADASAGYMIMRNNSDSDIRVSRITSDVFGRVELHETTMNDNTMQMRQLDELVIPAAGEVRLQPGRMHLMLFEPLTDLRQMTSVRLTLYDGNKPVSELTTIVSRGNPHE